MNTQILFGVAVVPAVVGLVEVCKDLGLPTRAAPAAAVVFGVLAALAQIYAGTWPWAQAVVLGIALGLSACGLYSGAKTVAAKATGTPTSGTAPGDPLTLLREIMPGQPAAPATPAPTTPAPATPAAAAPKPARPKKPRATKPAPPKPSPPMPPAPTDGRTGG